MLHLHVGERADALAAGLPAVLVDPEADPFQPAVLSVPTRGVERWLTQTLSHSLGATAGGEAGVSANIDFPFPGRLVDTVVAAAAGIDPRTDPWRGSRLVWPLLEVVDANASEPWLELLAGHIGVAPGSPESRRKRRAAVISHIGRLFAGYAVNRPGMIRAWAEGADTDGSGSELPPATAWQAELWRRLRTRIGSPSPPERLAAACERLREDPGLAPLPERISVFGLTRLPASQLEVLDALAARREVHLFILHPSRALWDEIAAADPPPSALRRADDASLDRVSNPLLASWGHDARELQLVLCGRDDATVTRHEVDHATDSLLHRLQAQISSNEAPPGPPAADTPERRPLLAEDDRSVQVHSCHGRERQVEVLRNAIMHLLAADPTLEPRDVIVMCPNVEDFAPLIHAVFGSGRLAAVEDELVPGTAEAPAPPDLRVRLADRSLRRTNPILGAVAEILELTSARLTASQLLDFANLDPVRRRFGFDDDDLSRILEWINEAHIHWGIDEAQRAPYNVPVAEGTWVRGLDRILLGVAMSEDDARIFNYVLPLDDVESGAISLAGRFAELIDRIDAAFVSFAEARTLDAWIKALSDAADNLTAPAFGEEWERLELDRLLEEMATEAGAGGTTLTLPEVRSLLTPRLAGRPTTANFRTGHISVCTLSPMRSVPHRVVCLLGLDQEAFPRKTPRDGDDLLLADPHIADRDPRTEDRQLLLDALMAAGEHLVITYTGNDERTNLEVPPAVPVGELIDVVDATVQHPQGAKHRIVVRHPLQPFDRRNFDCSGPAAPKPWAFSRVNLAGAQALEGERAEAPSFLAGPLPPPEQPSTATSAVLELDDLVKFVEHPVRAFLKQRLGIEVRDFFDEVTDDLPIELDGLGRWQVGSSYLASRRRGVPEREALMAEVRRGLLPPEQLGKAIVDEAVPKANMILAVAERVLPTGARESCDLRVQLSGGTVLTGTIGGIERGILGDVTMSKLKPKQRLGAWVRLLALTAARPDQPWEAVTVGMHPIRKGAHCVSRFGDLGDDEAARSTRALSCLEAIVDLHRRGMREPLPLFCESSAAYAAATAEGNDGYAAAAKRFNDAHRFTGEISDEEHRFAFPGISSLDDIRALEPRPDETGAGWASGETSRFGRLAHRLWHLPLQHESMGSE